MTNARMHTRICVVVLYVNHITEYDQSHSLARMALIIGNASVAGIRKRCEDPYMCVIDVYTDADVYGGLVVNDNFSRL